MRTKLLRALAHLKAAQLHIKAAEEILSDYRCRGASMDDCAQAKVGIGETLRHVAGLYVKAVLDKLTPAGKP